MYYQEDIEELKKATEVLYVDYVSDKELTVFTNLDSEDFYEAK